MANVKDPTHLRVWEQDGVWWACTAYAHWALCRRCHHASVGDFVRIYHEHREKIATLMKNAAAAQDELRRIRTEAVTCECKASCDVIHSADCSCNVGDHLNLRYLP